VKIHDDISSEKSLAVVREEVRGAIHRHVTMSESASSAWDEDEDGERGRSISLILRFEPATTGAGFESLARNAR
jgi:hypothetical protein